MSGTEEAVVPPLPVQDDRTTADVLAPPDDAALPVPATVEAVVGDPVLEAGGRPVDGHLRDTKTGEVERDR